MLCSDQLSYFALSPPIPQRDSAKMLWDIAMMRAHLFQHDWLILSRCPMLQLALAGVEDAPGKTHRPSHL